MSDDKIVQFPPQDQSTAAPGTIPADVLMQTAMFIAQHRRMMFLSHVAAGFTEEQALTLCAK